MVIIKGKVLVALYDTIGLNYSNLRKPDHRIAAMIEAGLWGATTVLNVGAGAGSYEPSNKQITAIEPSIEMIKQRQGSDATIIHGVAESLPFADNSFDASMAILTIHHWKDQQRGAEEMRRVTRGRVLFLTFDVAAPFFWLGDYLPELVTLDEKQMPRMESFHKWLGPVEIRPVMIPSDCTDGFLAAYWQRPEAYLDANVREAISSFRILKGLEEGLSKLKDDLDSGRWQDKYGHLLDLDELDCGYRLVTTL